MAPGPKIQGVVPADQMPEVLRGYAELAGVFIGGCVERGVGSSFRAQAHAHTRGEKKGWICIRGWRRLYQRALLIHELAHILTNSGHDDRWREKIRELGGRVEARYQKQKRKPCACGAHKFGNAGARWYAADNKWHSWRSCRVADTIRSIPASVAASPAQVQGEAMQHFIKSMFGGAA